MTSAISAVLGPAIGIAVSPVPIIAVILMLFSPRARVTGPAFLAGWALTLGLGCGAGYLLAHAGLAESDGATNDSIGWGRLAFGTLFLVLAARQWRNRPADGEPPTLPRWTEQIAAFGPGRAFGVAAVLSGANPKNLVLLLSAGAGLATAGPSRAEALTAIAVLVLVGSLTVATPVIYHVTAPQRAEVALSSAKAWLAAHNTVVLVIVFVVLGLTLIVQGLSLVGP